MKPELVLCFQVTHRLSEEELERSEDPGDTWAGSARFIGLRGHRVFYKLKVRGDPVSARPSALFS